MPSGTVAYAAPEVLKKMSGDIGLYINLFLINNYILISFFINTYPLKKIIGESVDMWAFGIALFKNFLFS